MAGSSVPAQDVGGGAGVTSAPSPLPHPVRCAMPLALQSLWVWRERPGPVRRDATQVQSSGNWPGMTFTFQKWWFLE